MFAQPRPKKSVLPPPSKRRKVTYAIEEINFDNGARADYLTGFHKRKVQRTKQAQAQAKERERKERLQLRKEVREERKQAVEDHVANVEALLREAQQAGMESDRSNSDSDSGDEAWGGFEDKPAPLPEPENHEEEYIDEDLYTTVRVEGVSIDRDGLHNQQDLDAEDSEKQAKEAARRKAQEALERQKDHSKKKKRKFRYETKVERQITRRKDKARSISKRG